MRSLAASARLFQAQGVIAITHAGESAWRWAEVGQGAPSHPTQPLHQPVATNALTPTRSSSPWARTSSDCLEGYGPTFECWAANSRPAQLTAIQQGQSARGHITVRDLAPTRKNFLQTAIFLGDKKETNGILSARNLLILWRSRQDSNL